MGPTIALSPPARRAHLNFMQRRISCGYLWHKGSLLCGIAANRHCFLVIMKMQRLKLCRKWEMTVSNPIQETLIQKPQNCAWLVDN
jgi:hypothetical protein